MTTSDDSQAIGELHKRLLHLRSRLAGSPAHGFGQEGVLSSQHLERIEKLRMELASPSAERAKLEQDIRSTQEEIEVFLDWAEDVIPEVPELAREPIEVTAPPGSSPPLGFLAAAIPDLKRNY